MTLTFKVRTMRCEIMTYIGWLLTQCIVENMYWTFTSHGRMAHLADCLHQTPETRANAALRRDARNRWKASPKGDTASVPILQHTDLFNEGKPLSSEYESMSEFDNVMEQDYK